MRPVLKPGNVVSITCVREDGTFWTAEGVVLSPYHGTGEDAALILEGPDGVYSWEIIQSVTILSPAPEEWLDA